MGNIDLGSQNWVFWGRKYAFYSAWPSKAPIHPSTSTRYYSDNFLGRFYVFIWSQLDFWRNQSGFSEGLVHHNWVHKQGIGVDFWWNVIMSSELTTWKNSQTMTLEKRRATPETSRIYSGSVRRRLPVLFLQSRRVKRVFSAKQLSSESLSSIFHGSWSY